MSDWNTRKTVGDRHEVRVMRELEHRGWTAHRCGQGTYPTAIREALQRSDTALRQFPDLIASRGPDLVAIDAKTSLPSTVSDRYAVSRTCVRAGLVFAGANAPMPLFYVFGDLRVLTPAEVAHYTADSWRPPGGSYHLVSTARAHQFDEVFGAPAARSA
jgi:Holliday junction resolvase